MEIKREVKTFEVTHQCPICKEDGEMKIHSGTTLYIPKSFAHECTSCHLIEYYDKIYPRIEYEHIEKSDYDSSKSE